MRPAPAFLAAACLWATACQTQAAFAGPAVIDLEIPSVRQEVSAALAEALGRSQVELGPADPAGAAVVSVRPPPLGPLETRSVVEPIQFDVRLSDAHCALIRRDRAQTVPVRRELCRPVDR